jgi:hypothetical protein
VKKRPVDHVCGLNEIEQTADNLAEELVGKGDDDVSASMSEGDQSDSDESSSEDDEDVTLSTRGRKRKAKKMDGFLNEEELGDELPLSLRRNARKAAREEEDEDFADRLLVSARKKANETRIDKSNQDDSVREKVRNAFQQGLDMAATELQNNKHKPSLVSSAVEDALFRLYGGTTKDYKTKMRSLHFNLKDPNNKELRAHVLRGDISPDNFVRMTANELASKELAEYRKRKEEEALKMSVLDAEAAAKFSTAAALEVKGEKSKPDTKLKEAPVEVIPEVVSEQEEPESGEGKIIEHNREYPSPQKEKIKANVLEEDVEKERAPSGLDWASIKSASVQASKTQPNFMPDLSKIETLEKPETVTECDENLKKLFLPCPECLALGRDKWEGSVSVPGIGNCTMTASSLSGCGDIEVLLGKGLSVKGRLSLESLDKFLSELHLSKHRTATVGILQQSSNHSMSTEESVGVQTLLSHYKQKDRAGVAKSTSGVEVYLIPECPLATKLLEVAQYLEPENFKECITKQGIETGGPVGTDVFVAVAVHKKDMIAKQRKPPPSVAPTAALPAGLDLHAISALAQAIGVGQPNAPNPPPPPPPMVPAALPPNLDLSGISALAQAFGVADNPAPMSSSGQGPMVPSRPAPMKSSKPTPMKKL